MSGYLLHELLYRSASAHPDRLAVVDGARNVTYGQLADRAARVSGLLRELGVDRGDRVGVYLDKSVECLAGLYGILMCGAAYVPLDPRAPAARLAYIIRNCGLRTIVTGVEMARAWPGLFSEGVDLRSLVVLNGPAAELQAMAHGIHVVDRAAADDRPADPPEVDVNADDLAYILYTSGSTGDPKGVMLSHRNALGFVEWASDVLALGPEDRLSSHAPLHFDLSVFDVFAASRSGASVWLVPSSATFLPAAVARWMQATGVTIWYSVPSILSLLADKGGLQRGGLPRLRAVVFAGEVFPTKYLRKLMGLLPEAQFHNWYGPTETNVCTAYRVPSPPDDDEAPIPIGRPITGMDAFVVTEDGRRARRGGVGELHVRGTGVMQGYWGDPVRTAQVLVPDPTGEDGDRVYRTGDLVREDHDGNLMFLGRKDDQIKSRGYRIELGDIEAALLAHPLVVEAAAVAIPDELLTNRIEAFLTVREPLASIELARFCGQRLPRYMIPEAFEFVEALPKTSTGKIDRQRLAQASVMRRNA